MKITKYDKKVKLKEVFNETEIIIPEEEQKRCKELLIETLRLNNCSILGFSGYYNDFKKDPFFLKYYVKKLVEEFKKNNKTYIYEINHYCCQNCHTIYTTIDLDVGVTPFSIKCFDCRGYCNSFMYSAKGLDYVMPLFGWHRRLDIEKMSNHELEHWFKGGLELRPLTSDEIVKIYSTIY